MRVKTYLHALQVTAAATRDLFIGRILQAAAGVARDGFQYAGYLSKSAYAPEATAGKGGQMRFAICPITAATAGAGTVLGPVSRPPPQCSIGNASSMAPTTTDLFIRLVHQYSGHLPLDRAKREIFHSLWCEKSHPGERLCLSGQYDPVLSIEIRRFLYRRPRGAFVVRLAGLKVL